MAKRGRPKQGITTHFKDTYIHYEYHRLRMTEEKHSAAVREVATVLTAKLGVSISETEVRRSLAFWKSRNSPNALMVSKPDPSNRALTLGLPVKALFLATWGPREVYPRHNAADKTSKRRRLAPVKTSE